MAPGGALSASHTFAALVRRLGLHEVLDDRPHRAPVCSACEGAVNVSGGHAGTRLPHRREDDSVREACKWGYRRGWQALSVGHPRLHDGLSES